MRFLAKGHEVTFKAGDYVYRLGDAVGKDAIFYVISGKVELRRKLKDGFDFLYPVVEGDTFGVVSAMAGKPREQDALVLQDAKLYCWAPDAFESAVSLYIEFARLSIQHLSRYLRGVNRALSQ